MSTHNVWFELKIRKLGIPLQTPVLFFYIEVGFKGVYISRTCFPDVKSISAMLCLRARHFYFPLCWFKFSTHEALAPFGHDLNNVDCDVKP